MGLSSVEAKAILHILNKTCAYPNELVELFRKNETILDSLTTSELKELLEQVRACASQRKSELLRKLIEGELHPLQMLEIMIVNALNDRGENEEIILGVYNRLLHMSTVRT